MYSCSWHFSKTLLQLVMNHFEGIKSSATAFPLIEKVVVVTVSYGCSTFKCEQRLVICFFWHVLCRIKLFMPERIYLEMREAILKALFLKKAEKSASTV